MKKSIIYVGLMALIPFLSIAQAPGWHMLDLKKDSVYGIGITKAYQELLKGKRSKPVIVAVLDGGIDPKHADLSPILWKNDDQAGDQDLDKNGYAGDVNGWNFLGSKNGNVTNESVEYQRVYFKFKDKFSSITDEKQLKKADRFLYRQWLLSKSQLTKNDTAAPITNRDKINTDNDADINDRYYGNANLAAGAYLHGTHVAGIIAAARDNGIGMDGVADNVSIMTIRAVPDGDEHDKDIALGIRYAVDNGAKIINMSFGKTVSPYKKFVDDAIKYAAKKKVLIVNAAGNSHQDVDSLPTYPTSYLKNSKKRAANMITVGASGPTLRNLIASFSNYGKNNVDVFAPGVGIYATLPNNKYGPLSGTSMATPVVVGLAAVLMEYYPKLSIKQVKQIIEESVTKVNDLVVKPGSKGKKVPMTELCKTGGIVNAYNAILLAEKMSK